MNALQNLISTHLTRLFKKAFVFAWVLTTISAAFGQLVPQPEHDESMRDNANFPTKTTQHLHEKIFNGVNFEGWLGDLDSYAIENGVMKCKRGRGGNVFTKKIWSDFSVRFQFRLPPGGNNGLAIRYPGKGDTAYVGMCELQILDNSSPNFKDLDPRQLHGSAYGIVGADKGALLPQGQWNSQEVTVVGTKIKVELNGTIILDTDVAPFLKPDAKFLDNKAHPGLARTEGHFGFAGHNDEVEFREIYLQDLSETKNEDKR